MCWRERKYELALAKFRILAEDCLLKIYFWLLHCSLDNDDFNIINFAFINISPFIYRQTLIFTQISFIVGKLVTVAWLIMLVVRGVTIPKAVLWLELSLHSFLMDNVHIWLRGNWKICLYIELQKLTSNSVPIGIFLWMEYGVSFLARVWMKGPRVIVKKSSPRNLSADRRPTVYWQLTYRLSGKQ